MGLLAADIIEIMIRIQKLKKKKISLCMIGKQDVHVDWKHFVKLINLYGFSYDEQLCADIEKENTYPLDSYKIFRMFKVDKVSAVDYSDYEGADIILDLNKDLPEKYREEFDVVINGGTLEHVFDVKTAMDNITNMVKPGGFVYHIAPCAGWTDHGFYSFSPTFFLDYYSSNEYSISALFLACLCRKEEEGHGHSDVIYSQDCRLFRSTYELNCYMQQYLNERRINICCFCEKIKTPIEDRIPLQGLYQETYESRKQVAVEEKVKRINFKKVMEVFQNHEQVVIYGAGNDCNLLIDELYKHDLEDKCEFIFDSDIRRAGGFFRGYKIYYPTTIKSESVKTIFISSRKYGDEIKCELEKNVKFKGQVFLLSDYEETV